mmetsp:Transcript_30216/g.55878  ORF Transcript_30216/g.55878 Transcript_30216/m.55878 type:complete len:241 (-) Transcript_30216:299-1021(-)
MSPTNTPRPVMLQLMRLLQWSCAAKPHQLSSRMPPMDAADAGATPCSPATVASRRLLPTQCHLQRARRQKLGALGLLEVVGQPTKPRRRAPRELQEHVLLKPITSLGVALVRRPPQSKARRQISAAEAALTKASRMACTGAGLQPFSMHPQVNVRRRSTQVQQRASLKTSRRRPYMVRSGLAPRVAPMKRSRSTRLQPRRLWLPPHHRQRRAREPWRHTLPCQQFAAQPVHCLQRPLSAK